MDNTQPDLSLGIKGVDGIWEALQPIHTSDQDVFDTVILHLDQNIKPELGPFVSEIHKPNRSFKLFSVITASLPYRA